MWEREKSPPENLSLEQLSKLDFKITYDDWGCLVNKLERIERMLKWLVIDSKLCDEEDWVVGHEKSEEYENVRKQLPDISDILEEKK